MRKERRHHCAGADAAHGIDRRSGLDDGARDAGGSERSCTAPADDESGALAREQPCEARDVVRRALAHVVDVVGADLLAPRRRRAGPEDAGFVEQDERRSPPDEVVAGGGVVVAGRRFGARASEDDDVVRLAETARAPFRGRPVRAVEQEPVLPLSRAEPARELRFVLGVQRSGGCAHAPEHGVASVGGDREGAASEYELLHELVRERLERHARLGREQRNRAVEPRGAATLAPSFLQQAAQGTACEAFHHRVRAARAEPVVAVAREPREDGVADRVDRRRARVAGDQTQLADRLAAPDVGDELLLAVDRAHDPQPPAHDEQQVVARLTFTHDDLAAPHDDHRELRDHVGQHVVLPRSVAEDRRRDEDVPQFGRARLDGCVVARGAQAGAHASRVARPFRPRK